MSDTDKQTDKQAATTTVREALEALKYPEERNRCNRAAASLVHDVQKMAAYLQAILGHREELGQHRDMTLEEMVEAAVEVERVAADLEAVASRAAEARDDLQAAVEGGTDGE